MRRSVTTSTGSTTRYSNIYNDFGDDNDNDGSHENRFQNDNIDMDDHHHHASAAPVVVDVNDRIQRWVETTLSPDEDDMNHHLIVHDEIHITSTGQTIQIQDLISMNQNKNIKNMNKKQPLEHQPHRNTADAARKYKSFYLLQYLCSNINTSSHSGSSSHSNNRRSRRWSHETSTTWKGLFCVSA